MTSGIWRPVILEAWNDVKVEDVFIRQPSVTKEKAQLVAEVCVNSDKQQCVTIAIMNEGKMLLQEQKELRRGENKISIPYVIQNPRLWWSNGLGEQNLYDFTILVTSEEGVVAEKKVTTGLRSLRLVREKDQWGESFGFELNGVPVFAKGANAIPNDVFLPRVTPDLYEKMVADAANANMNMIRIWGGGIYEDDAFLNFVISTGSWCGRISCLPVRCIPGIKSSWITCVRRLLIMLFGFGIILVSLCGVGIMKTLWLGDTVRRGDGDGRTLSRKRNRIRFSRLTILFSRDTSPSGEGLHGWR